MLDSFYYVNGRRTYLTCLDTAVAVRVPNSCPETRRAAYARRLGKRARDSHRNSGEYLNHTARNKLEGCGWEFADPDADSRTAANRSSTCKRCSVRNVYVDETGATKICTEYMVVKAYSNRTQAQAISLLKRQGLKVVHAYLTPGVFKVKVQAGKEPLSLVQHFSKNDHFEFADPVLVEVLGKRGQVSPDAPDWHIQLIKADKAWQFGGKTNQGKGVRVAVIDDGFCAKEGVFADVHQGGQFRSVGTGKTEFHARKNDFPTNDHGAGVSGLVCSKKYGVAPEASLMPIACFDGDVVSTQEAVASAIRYAVNPSEFDKRVVVSSEDGADIITCSLGPSKSATFQLQDNLRDAIDYAAKANRRGDTSRRGIPIFWATANVIEDIKLDEVCCHRYTIAVASSDCNNQKGKSVFGGHLDLVAPGVHVHTIDKSGHKKARTGSSFAAPQAAGVAALLLAQDPTLSRAALWKTIRLNASRDFGVGFPDGKNPDFGYGGLNAFDAIRRFND